MKLMDLVQTRLVVCNFSWFAHRMAIEVCRQQRRFRSEVVRASRYLIHAAVKLLVRMNEEVPTEVQKMSFAIWGIFYGNPSRIHVCQRVRVFCDTKATNCRKCFGVFRVEFVLLEKNLIQILKKKMLSEFAALAHYSRLGPFVSSDLGTSGSWGAWWAF